MIKSIDSNIVQKAFRYAKIIRSCSDYKRYKLGACIFTNKKILVGAANTNKTSPLQYKYNKYREFDDVDPKAIHPCCHAEMSALIRLKKLYPYIDPSELNIFVYREDFCGKPVIAKPCKACEKALRDYGIKKVYYTDKNKICFEYYL